MKNENTNKQDPSINVSKNADSSLDKKQKPQQQQQQQQPNSKQMGASEQNTKLQQGQSGKKTQAH